MSVEYASDYSSVTSDDDEEEEEEEEEEVDRVSCVLAIETEPFANRTQAKSKRVYVTKMRGYQRFDLESQMQCRYRIREYHREKANDLRTKVLYPNAFDDADMDGPIRVRIDQCLFAGQNSKAKATDDIVKNTIARAMVEIVLLRDSTLRVEDLKRDTLLSTGKALMKNYGIRVQSGYLTCPRIWLHWIRLDGFTKYFNVHNRDQYPPTKAQLAERKWPLHPLFIWLYATRPLFNDPHMYAFSRDFGLFDAMQLRSFVVILASLCNVNEWYIDVDQLENALWKPNERDRFEIYNHIHRFVDMFYHSGPVFIDAVVNHGLAATVGRFLTMRAARYMRRAFYDVMRNWHIHHSRMGAYGEFMRQHHWVVAHFLISADETPEMLSCVNDEYVDLRSFLLIVAERHDALFRRLHEKDTALYPRTTGDIGEFVVRFYRMVMDMFRLQPRLALMGISALAHDLSYLQDRRISVIIPGDFYVDRNFERYDILGRRWNERPDLPAPTEEELFAFRQSVNDPEKVDVVVASSLEEQDSKRDIDDQTISSCSSDNEDKEEEEEEEEDLEIIRYKRRKMLQERAVREHPDMQFEREAVCLYAAFEKDGVLAGFGNVTRNIVEEVPDAPPEKDLMAQERLENAMRRYFRLIFGEVPDLQMYSMDNLPDEYHHMYMQKYSVHRKKYRDEARDPDSITFFDVPDMELMYNALINIPDNVFIRACPDGTTASVRIGEAAIERELRPKDVCVDDDDARYADALPNAIMRHAFFHNYVVSVPRRWRKPMLKTLCHLKSGISCENYLRLDRDNESLTPLTDATGRSEFMRRLVKQHRPDHERVSIEEYVLPIPERRGTKRKRARREIPHAFSADRRSDMVTASNYRMAVGKDSGEVTDYRFDPRFDHLFPLGMLVAVLEQEGSVRKLVKPFNVQMIPFVELDTPANASPCIDTIPYLTQQRVNLPVFVSWSKETNAFRELNPPERVLGFFDAFFVFSKNNTFATSGIFCPPPTPTHEEEEAASAKSVIPE